MRDDSFRPVGPRRPRAWLALGLVAVAWASASPARAEGPERIRVLVLEPTASNVDSGQTKVIGGLIAAGLADDARLDVISGEDVKKMVELEAERATIGCADDSCLAELAGAMGAEYVVFGDAGRLGKLLVLNLNLFDSGRARSVGRVAVTTQSIEELPAKLLPALGKLTERLAPPTPDKASGNAPDTDGTEGESSGETGPSSSTNAAGSGADPAGPGARVESAGESAGEPGGGLSPLVFAGAGAVGVGLLVVTGGIATDTALFLADEKAQTTFEPTDLLGGGIALAGALVTVVGIGLVTAGFVGGGE